MTKQKLTIAELQEQSFATFLHKKDEKFMTGGDSWDQLWNWVVGQVRGDKPKSATGLTWNQYSEAHPVEM